MSTRWQRRQREVAAACCCFHNSTEILFAECWRLAPRHFLPHHDTFCRTASPLAAPPVCPAGVSGIRVAQTRQLCAHPTVTSCGGHRGWRDSAGRDGGEGGVTGQELHPMTPSVITASADGGVLPRWSRSQRDAAG